MRGCFTCQMVLKLLSQHKQAYADEDAALGMGEVRVYPRDYQFGLLLGYIVPQHRFHKRVEAESAGNGKQQGQNRDDGQQGAVCQSRCSYRNAVAQKLPDGQYDDFYAGIKAALHGSNFILGDAPDAVTEKLQPVPDGFLVHRCVGLMKKIAARL